MSQLPEANAESCLPGASPTISVSAQRCIDAVTRAVCRIDFPDRDSGTGILLGGRWLLTCHHVLPSRARAGQVKALIFGYERDESGQLHSGISLRLAPDEGFHTSNPNHSLTLDQHDDWTLVRVATDPKLTDFGQAPLHEDAIVHPNAHARIIQHPAFAEKSCAEGRIASVQDRRITYRINTEGGSSGSPVINIEGKIIALHHRGTDQTHPYYNSGVPIQRVIAGIKALKDSPWPDLCKPPPPRTTPTQVLWPTKLRHTAEKLIGREDELALLHHAWDNPETNLLVVRGKGGEGKTALVAAWMAELTAQDWRGAARVLDWSFYSQGTRDQTAATAEVFIHDALERLGDPDPNAGDGTARATRLAKLIGEQRCLLVLDGLEPLQYPPGPLRGALKDPGMAALLRGLAARNAGLCVVTTRERVLEIEAHYDKSTVDRELKKLSPLAGAQLLHHSGARRAGKKAISADDPELQKASEEVHGHALTLALMGQYLRLMAGGADGDIRQRDRMKLADADKEYTNDATRPYGHAFKAMEAYERWFADGDPAARRQLAVLRLLGLFDRPAPADCLAALRGGDPIPNLTDEWTGAGSKDWSIALTRLQEINLLSVGEDGAVDCHPLLREYFALRLKEKHPAAFRAGHSRLFDHLCASTPHRPDTLPGLQPLYQALTHGCLAGRHVEALEKVYRDRILRGTGHDGFYSSRKLGAIGADLGAVAAFFDELWTRLSPHLSAPAEAWLLNQAAVRLRALGRLTEAVEPMRVAVKMAVEAENWKSAAIRASNLTELEIALGRLGEAVADGRRGIEFADRSEEAFQKTVNRAATADALHQAGEQTEAGALFAEAERMQADCQPEFPLLYSLRGFRYADLLLAPAERAAWQRVIAECGARIADGDDLSNDIAACAEVERRAAKLFEWRMPNDTLLDIALDHLTQTRAALYRALLMSDSSFILPPTAFSVALAKLRAANSLNHLPQALLTAAFYHGTLGGDPAEAARLLDEAQQIAERGPMPLYLADVHLHRARLAGRMNEAERKRNWPGVDPRAELAKARALIEQHGYGRRREELADAEAALT